MDAVIMIDDRGRVRYWNPAAEAMFGITAEEADGQDMAELVIPPWLREQHRQALTVSDLGGTSSILGRRIEVVGQRRDGSTFPVELTITRTDRAGVRLFTGYLRDVTERHRLTAEIRESRARLLEVSDETRRRIERDLHDGAQQQLVGAAMAVNQARESLAADPDLTHTLLERAGDVLVEAITEIRELARGVLPGVLSDHGLQPALTELVRRSPVPVDLDVEIPRLPSTVETTLYFLAAEALTNAAKHGATGARIDVHLTSNPDRSLVDPTRLVVCTVADDGPGGADPARGSGLRGLEDRLLAVGGVLAIDSPQGHGTRLTGRIAIPGLDSATTATSS